MSSHPLTVAPLLAMFAPKASSGRGTADGSSAADGRVIRSSMDTKTKERKRNLDLWMHRLSEESFHIYFHFRAGFHPLRIVSRIVSYFLPSSRAWEIAGTNTAS